VLRRARRKVGKAGPPTVRPARLGDLPEIARIASTSFRGMRPLPRATKWVRCCWASSPRCRYWIVIVEGQIVGYVLWTEKGGFRDKAVVELEQVAVEPGARRKGIGYRLIRTSLSQLRGTIEKRGARLKLVEVTTGVGQSAVGFYRRTLGARVVARLPEVFDGDERVLHARPGR